MKKRLLSLLLICCLVVGLLPTAANAAGTDSANTQLSAFSLWPSSSSLSFDEDSYTGTVGETVYITAIYVCEQAPTDFNWECSTENAVTFSATSTMGPAETGEENTYWISTAATSVKEGTCTVKLTVKADSAWTATDTTEITITQASRYAVLILDTSGSMDGTPMQVQREAAIKFCTAMLAATGNNYIAIVKLNTTSSTVCNFSDDLDTLTNSINQMSASGGTNINQALTVAQGLLDNIADSVGTIKNIVLCSDGLPQSGTTSTSGPYTSSDHSYYGYGNAVYNTATTIKESGVDIYTLGFFHSLSDSGLTFGRQLMSDIATSEDCYYEVTDVEDLEFTFWEIAENITVEPVSINIAAEQMIYAHTGESTIWFWITAVITNNSKTTDLTNLFVHLDEGDGAEIVTEYGEWKQTADILAAGDSATFSWVIEINREKYPDGGAHFLIVYAGSDQTVTSSAQGSVAVEATNGKSNELDFWTDVWNFCNFSENGHHSENTYHIDAINEDDKNVLLSDLSPSEREKIQKTLETNGNGGHCFGMALTTILSKMNIFDITDYSDATCLRDADFTDRINSILCYYHVLQVLNSFTSVVQEYMLKVYNRSEDGTGYIRKSEEEARQGVIEQLTILAEKADAVKSGGCPVLLDFGCEGWGAHAVVAYATESGSWTYDGVTYNKRVLVYDSNASNNSWKVFNPIWNEDCCLYFNEGTDEWIIPSYSTYLKDGVTLPCMVSTNENAYLKRACNSLDILNIKNYDASLYNYIAELRCQNETAMRLANAKSQYIIMGKSGSVTGDTDLLTYYDADAISNESNISTLHVVLPDEKEDYTVSTLSGNAEALDFYISDEDLFLSIDADAAVGSAFTLDGKITLFGNENNYTVKIADDNIAEGEFNTYTFSGKSTGDTSFDVTEDGVLITGDDLTDITVIGKDGDTEAELTFSSDYKSVLVIPIEDNTALIVLVDTDNDNIYETPLDEVSSKTVYTITLDSNGGTVSTNTVTTGTDGTLSSLPTPTRDGYTFTGWYTAANGGTKVTTSTVFNADTTVYAHWTFVESDSPIIPPSAPSNGSTNYSASAPSNVENGTVTVNPQSATKGDTVTITATPDAGYELADLTVTDASGRELALTDKGNGTYTFIMPASQVTVTASFAEIKNKPEPVVNPFADVFERDYYYDAVLWAVENGITYGTSATTFSPDLACTRAQIVTFLWRAAGSPEPTGNHNPFTDVKASDYYYEAVLWAAENGITEGTSATTFSPDLACTRDQAVTFLWRAAGKPSPISNVNPFTDVKPGQYYTDAVLWAAENGITEGTSATTFSPGLTCTRAQIVTFLYRSKK